MAAYVESTQEAGPGLADYSSAKRASGRLIFTYLLD